MEKMIRILSNVRLAFFPIAYALSGVLIGSTLNRIMIAELGYSATLVALFFAIPLMISPIRVWVGYRSDAFPIWGKRREPYIMFGALAIGLGIVAITNLITAGNTWAILLGVALSFVLYGLGRNISHNTFQALVADRYEGAARSRAATLYEVTTMLGMVMGAGIIKGALKIYEPERLVALALAVAGAVLILSILATIGQEARGKLTETAAEIAREVKFSEAFRKVILEDKQVRLFFIIVVLTFVGTLAQDVLLEPYGGLVLGMSVGETTGLTQYWGIGVLISMLACGLFLLKALGYMRVMRTGMLVSALAFVGPILAGVIGNAALFKGAVFIMGLGTGLAGAGMLSGALAFTTRIRAGMLLGVWGVANMTGHAFGSLLGGVTVDSVRALTGSPFLAYAAVFAMEIIFLVIALSLTFRLSMEEAQAQREEKSLPEFAPAD
ncbi:MAG: BCD family MFS transporter [Anaerolineales bacterium]